MEKYSLEKMNRNPKFFTVEGTFDTFEKAYRSYLLFRSKHETYRICKLIEKNGNPLHQEVIRMIYDPPTWIIEYNELDGIMR